MRPHAARLSIQATPRVSRLGAWMSAGLIALSGCEASYPEGTIACDRDRDCPTGWVCGLRLDAGSGGFCSRFGAHSSPAEERPDTAAMPEVSSSDSEDAGDAEASTDAPGGADAPAPDAPGGGDHETPAGESDPKSPPDADGEESPPLEPFHVISTEPAEKGVLEDLHGPLTVIFSDEVDASSVNAQSFVVSRSETELGGKLEVSGNRVTFTRTGPWVQAAVYVVELTAQLRSRDQRALIPSRLEFSAREGVWQAPELVSSGDDSMFLSTPRLAVSALGKVALGWTIGTRSRYRGSAAVRRENDGNFTPLAGFGEGPFSAIAIDDMGRIIAVGGQLDSGQSVPVNMYDPMGMYSRVLLAGMGIPSLAYGAHFDEDYASILRIENGKVMNDSILFGSFESVSSYVFSADGADEPDFTTSPGEGHNWIAVWTQRDADAGNTSSVWVTDRIWSAGCSADACPQQLSRPSHNASQPAIASDRPRRSIVAVWREEDDPWPTIYAARAVGTAAWSERIAISDKLGEASQPAVSLDARGNAIAVWIQADGGAERIMGASLDLHQAAWSKPTAVSGRTDHVAWPPALAIEPGGNARAIWTQDPSAESPGSDVWSALYVAGQGWRPPVVLSIAGQADSEPAIGIADSGQSFASWTEDNKLWLRSSE